MEDVSRTTLWFTGASRARQWLLIGALVVVLFALLAGAYWALRPHYQVLFSGMRPQDTSNVVAELEKQKFAYRLDGDGDNTSVLVPSEDVRAIRIKLMSGDLKLKNVVGMELFNNSDLGLTDFAQKVNYQRALQGELARTIMSIDQVDMARVHLTMPESSIFRNDQDHPKASVALSLRDEQPLAQATVRGIQRLVASAVPHMRPVDVTVVDERGAPLTNGDLDMDDPKFAIKQSIERYYQRKLLDQLTPFLQDNHATVSINAEINFDQVTLTRQSDTATPGDSSTYSLPPMPGNDKPGRKASLPPLPPSGVSTAEKQKTQRTLEQIVSAPGSIRRLSVGIVLDRALSTDQSKQLQALVAAAVGMDTARGDTVSMAVRTMPSDNTKAVAQTDPAHGENAPAVAVTPAEKEDMHIATAASKSVDDPVLILIGSLLAGGLGIGLLLRVIWPRRASAARLSESERKALAQRLQRLLSESENAHVQR